MYAPLNLCIIQGHPHTVCNACNVCNDWNVCNVCPMCLNLMIIQGHPHNMSKYALHRGVSQPPVFSKKNAPFRRQTCGTSTNVLKIRSVSDTFENGKKCTQKRPGAVTSKKSAPYVMHVMYVMYAPLNLCIIQGHPHNMLYTEGCHNHLSLAKKMRRFADKLAVPPQMYLKYEVSVTLLKMEKSAPRSAQERSHPKKVHHM